MSRVCWVRASVGIHIVSIEYIYRSLPVFYTPKLYNLHENTFIGLNRFVELWPLRSKYQH